MKHYEDMTYPARTEKVCTKRICDLCGTKSEDDDWVAGATWSEEETELKIIVKEKRVKYSFGDVDGESYEIDLCPKCFRDRLVPWLKSEGANIEEKDFSW